jgi:predicted TIM-barrel fold metal-dependent hydrolase
VEKGSWADVLRQEELLTALHRQHPDQIAYVATFSLEGLDEKGWAEKVIRWIEKCRAQGAVAVKVWKNVGMEFRDKNKRLVMVDDPRLRPVFQFLEENRIPLIAHLGEPRNCWLPLEKMTTNNDRSYFKSNPQYHMFLHPEMPPYEAQLAARDSMLDQHPKLRFLGCHLASIEWDVELLGRWLERYPNAVVDLAARIGNLQHQTLLERDRVRRFFLSYQDRVLYGTDSAFRDSPKAADRGDTLLKMWQSDWKYWVTDEWMEVPKVNGKFQGLKLPREVVDKIYSQNALRWLPEAFPAK